MRRRTERRWGIITKRAVMALAILWAVSPLAGAPIHAVDVLPPPSEEDLAAVILTPEEVGEGYAISQAGPLDALFANYHVLFQRTAPTPVIIAVWLVDASAGSAEDAARAFTDGFTSAVGGRSEQSDAPPLGQDTVRYVFTGIIADRELPGEVLVWRQGAILALVAILSTGDVEALEFALAQQAKLVAAFGRDP